MEYVYSKKSQSMQKKTVFIAGRTGWLEALSSEHKDGLLFASRIREGLKRNVSLEILKDYAFWYWRTHIRPHFRHEEDVLLPNFPPGNKLAQRMRNEHDMIRELVICLDEEPDQRTLTLFADLIQDHIVFEENEMYTWLEKELTKAQLEKIQLHLEQKPLTLMDDWTQEFWIQYNNKTSKRTG